MDCARHSDQGAQAQALSGWQLSKDPVDTMTQLEEIKADGAGNVSGELRQCTAKVNDLPFTGGETMRGVLIAGILIAGLAVVSYAAYRKYGDSSRRRGTRLV